MNKNQAKELVARETGFQKSKIILLEMSSSDSVGIDYVRFEVLGRKATITYSSIHNKFLFDLEDDFSK